MLMCWAYHKEHVFLCGICCSQNALAMGVATIARMLACASTVKATPKETTARFARMDSTMTRALSHLENVCRALATALDLSTTSATKSLDSVTAVPGLIT